MITESFVKIINRSGAKLPILTMGVVLASNKVEGKSVSRTRSH